MKQFLIGMFILVVAFPLFAVGAAWLGYAIEGGANWLMRNTSVETVLPPIYTTTIVYKSQDRAPFDCSEGSR